jgi:hypothetical protein
MNMYIKEKSEYEVNDDSRADEDSRSIKTKAKSRKISTINHNSKVDQFDRNREVEVRSSKHPSPLLDGESQQLFGMDLHGGRAEKEPGKIRKADDNSHLEQTQNYIYEVEDG